MDAIEEYLIQVKARLDAEPMQKEAILSELRSHLWEKVRDLESHGATPGIALQRAVIDGFGTPEDVAAAYNKDPPPRPHKSPHPRTLVVTLDPKIAATARRADAAARRTAKRAARSARVAAQRAGTWTRTRAPGVAKAFGTVFRLVGVVLAALLRAIGRMLGALARAFGVTVKWAALSLLVVLTLVLAAAVFTGVFLFDDVQSLVAAQQGSQVLRVDEDCWTQPCTRAVENAWFYVNPAANRLTFTLWADTGGTQSGQVDVRVADPNGLVVLHRSVDMAVSHSVEESHRWAPTPGHWRLDYATEDFQGRLFLRADVRGV